MIKYRFCKTLMLISMVTLLLTGCTSEKVTVEQLDQNQSSPLYKQELYTILNDYIYYTKIALNEDLNSEYVITESEDFLFRLSNYNQLPKTRIDYLYNEQLNTFKNQVKLVAEYIISYHYYKNEKDLQDAKKLINASISTYESLVKIEQNNK